MVATSVSPVCVIRKTGCEALPDGTACTADADVCNIEQCIAGSCTGVPISCSDGVLCTRDTCDPVSGCDSTPDDDRCTTNGGCRVMVCDPVEGCQFVENAAQGTACDDGSLGTLVDQCNDTGQCVGSANFCDDGNPCTADNYVVGFGCDHVEQDNFPSCDRYCADLQTGDPEPDGTPCQDGNICTVNDTCDGAGNCRPGPMRSCDDGNACTTDVCVGTGNPTHDGCRYIDNQCDSDCDGLPNGTPCSDGQACTVGTCQDGVCDSEQLACDDGNDCNGTESCATSGGLTAAQSLCGSHPPEEFCGCSQPCDDGNPCTDDICLPNDSCEYVFNTGPCDDGDQCTSGDTCDAGVCEGTPEQVCGAADACTRVAFTEPATSPPDQNPRSLRLQLKKLNKAPGGQQISAKGLFNPASGGPSIDPAANGVHLRIESDSGEIYDVNLPGGPGCGPKDGWKVDSSRTKWSYKNKSGALPSEGCAPGSARGVTTLKFLDMTGKSKQAYSFSMKIKDALLTALPNNPQEIRFSLSLGAETSPGVPGEAADAGQCAEFFIMGDPIPGSKPAPYCRTKSSTFECFGQK